jgi:hypothetical protein
MSSSTKKIEWTRSDDRAAGTHADADAVHIAGWWQWFFSYVLRLKIPRALCGESLEADPGRPDPLESGAPLCPRCVELAGWGPDEIDRHADVPGYWLWLPDYFTRGTR